MAQSNIALKSNHNNAAPCLRSLRTGDLAYECLSGLIDSFI